MTIRIKALKDTEKVIVAMEKEQWKHKIAIENSFYDIGAILGNRVKQLIEKPPKTGRVYRYKGADHQASAPGEAPANRSGELVKSYNYNVHGTHDMEVGESVNYALYLEEGTKNKDGSIKMKPRPHFLRAIEETQGDAVNIFYEEFKKFKK